MSNTRLSLKEALQVEKLQTLSYKAIVPLDFCFDILAHGGFLIALVLTAIKHAFENDYAASNQPNTIDLHLSFLRPTLSGEVRIDIRDVQIGANTSTFQFSMSQRGKNSLIGFASNANLSKEKGFSFPTRFKLDPPPPSVNFQKLEANQDPNWVYLRNEWYPTSPFKAVTQMRHWFPTHGSLYPSMDEAWSCLSTPQGRFTNEMLGSVVDTYVRMIENMRDQGRSPWAVNAIVERAQRDRDGFPPPTLMPDVPVSYPTVSLTLEQKKSLPPEGVRWLYVRAETKSVANGRFDVEVLVFDESLDMVALSHQVCIIVDITKRRKKASSGMSDTGGKGKL